MSKETLRKSLQGSVPDASRLSIDATALDSHARDAWPLARKWSEQEIASHRPGVVVSPVSEEEVAQVVRSAPATAAIVAYGAGSGVTGAAVPPQDALVIDLRKMSAVVDFDPVNCTVTVGAGILAGELEKFLGERGFTLGHYPQSLHLATMGGLVSTRSSGTFSSKYGSIEQLVLGLRVVLATGEAVEIRPTVRSATGPELMHLFIGAEGTLGIITQVTVRIFPRAGMRWFGGYALPSIAQGVEAVRSLFAKHLRPAVLRLYDGVEAQGLYGRVGRHEQRPLLIIGHEGCEEMAIAERDVAGRLIREQGGEALGAAIGDAWEAHRYDASWIEVGNEGPRRMADAIEVAAPWSQLAPLYDRVMREVGPLCSRAMAHYSHFYSTGGCMYFIFFVEKDQPRDTYRRVWDRVMDITHELGGTASHHHGVGLVRSDRMAAEWGNALELLKKVKGALDPDNRMNPGKLGLAAARKPA